MYIYCIIYLQTELEHAMSDMQQTSRAQVGSSFPIPNDPNGMNQKRRQGTPAEMTDKKSRS